MTFAAWFKTFTGSLYDEFFGEPVNHPLLKRILAFVVDTLLFSAITSLISLLLYYTESPGFYFLEINLIITTLYFTVLTSKMGQGKTLGKRLFKLKVVDEKGAYVSFGRSLLRSLPLVLILNSYQIALAMHLAEVEFIHVMYGLYIFSLGIVYFSIAKSNRQGLHDLIASTQVVAKDVTVMTEKNLSPRLILGFLIFLGVVFYLSYLYIIFINKLYH